MNPADVTDELIESRLAACEGCTVEWTGSMPRDSARWNDLASQRLHEVTVAEVWDALWHSLHGADAAGEVDMAISIAAEPAGLPDNAAVALFTKP